jgi:cytochrome b
LSDFPLMVRVWDVPTRVFHWALAAAFAGEWLTRDARDLDVHEFLGYAIGALVIFRVAWGWLGTRWARFSSFPLSASSASRYLAALASRRAERHVGHNPAGSWAIYALLMLAALQVLTGVVALGAEQRLGPLAALPSYALGDAAHRTHEALAYAMLAVVAVHIAGVIVGSLLERENLLRSMLDGLKDAPAEAAVASRRGVAAAMIAVLGASSFAWFAGRPGDARAQPAAATLRLARDPSWQSECGGCHLAYQPSLLPARSWTALLAQQRSHFGEDLGLVPTALERLDTYARRNAAEAAQSPAAWKIAHTVPPGATPLRITETGYWKHRHASLDAQTWKRIHPSDCAACHRDAEGGLFSPLSIRVAEGAAVRPAAR